MSSEMSCSDVFVLREGSEVIRFEFCVFSLSRWAQCDVPDGHNRVEELDHLERVLLAREEKVETVLDFGDLEGVLVHAVLEDELLEVQERPLVVDFLSDLDEGAPGVLGGQPRALLALGALDDVLDLEDLLQNRSREDLCVFQRWSAPGNCLEGGACAPLSG